ncbi:MAG: flagellar biosynthetic protein FliR [Candidatus Margulisiibacteriota bacterium]
MILTLAQIQVFTLVFARIAGLFGQAAFFSFRTIPNTPKIAICFFITVVIWFVVPVPQNLPNNFLVFIIALLQEYLIGRLIGFVSFIIVKAILAAGDMMGMQMGLSVANQYDPSQGLQLNIVGRFFDFSSLIFFLCIDGHIMLITALQKSFTAIPIYSPVNIAAPMMHIVGLGTILWELSVLLAAPVILTIFLMDFAFGTISRVAPQVNVFMLGFQIKPLLGMLTLFLMMPLLLWRIVEVMNTILEKIIGLLGYLTI